MITSVIVILVKSEPIIHCLLLLILNLKYNLFSLVTGIKWCGSLHLFGSSNCLPECDLTFSHGCVLGFLDSFSFISLIMPMLSHTMPKSDQEVQERVKEVFSIMPCLWQIHIICGSALHYPHQQQHNYYCQDWLWEIYDLLDVCSLHQLWNCCHYLHLGYHFTPISLCRASVHHSRLQNIHMIDFYDYGKLWYCVE
jgi:hypothetical protein